MELRDDERLNEINENLRLIRKRDGLTFGTDAYLLAAFVRPEPRSLCVDLGSGTGILSLLLTAKDRVATAVAAEIQPAFADLIGRNVAINDLSGRVIPLLCDVRTLDQRSLGAALGREAACADVVVSNPPYMRTDSGKRNEHDEKYLARHEVCGGISEFCAAAARVLRFGGKFYLVYRPDRLTALFSALRENGLEPKRMVLIHADEDTEPSSVLIEARAGAHEGLSILPPLFLHEGRSRADAARPLSERARAIYDTMSFE